MRLSERHARGAYGGGSELFLANTFPREAEASLSYSSAVVLDLEAACVGGTIASGRELLEELSSFSEDQTGDDTEGGFGGRSLANGRPPLWHLMETLLASPPEGLLRNSDVLGPSLKASQTNP
jgi:hypothetical protein